jgi:hypothetical protein
MSRGLERGRSLKGEYLEKLALNMVIARWHERPQFAEALRAGATWEQITAARGTSVSRARMEYVLWAEQQHGLWTRYKAETGRGEGSFDHSIGISDEMYAAALRHAATP